MEKRFSGETLGQRTPRFRGGMRRENNNIRIPLAQLLDPPLCVAFCLLTGRQETVLTPSTLVRIHLHYHVPFTSSALAASGRCRVVGWLGHNTISPSLIGQRICYFYYRSISNYMVVWKSSLNCVDWKRTTVQRHHLGCYCSVWHTHARCSWYLSCSLSAEFYQPELLAQKAVWKFQTHVAVMLNVVTHNDLWKTYSGFIMILNYS